MSTAHTPGPWKLCYHLQSQENDQRCTCGARGLVWGSDEEHVVCEMGSTTTPGQEGMEPPRYGRDVELTNARLIAAAPELLEVLESFGVLACTPEWQDKKDAAIAKAKGIA